LNYEYLEKQEMDLLLPDFINENALEIGLIILNLAKAQKVPIAILIERNNIPIFTFFTENTSMEFLQRINIKKKIVEHFKKSSAYIISRYSPLEISNGINCTISHLESESLRGSFPIRVKNIGMIGSISVASLTGVLDHDYVVEGLRQFIRLYED